MPAPRRKAESRSGGRARPARAVAPRRPPSASRAKTPPRGERLQRVLAHAGIASRRACEELIAEGRVRVNGRIVRELPVFVRTGEDVVEVDGIPVKAPERHIYILLNKPSRALSAVADEPGAARRTVLDMVDHPSAARLYPVGRLDYHTMGLVLLTNDGELANRLTHPRYGIQKTYHAVVKGGLDDEALARLEEGIYLAERREGRTVGATRAAHVGLRLIKRDRDKSVLEVTLREGRNRQVRRMLAAVGCPVKRLERVAMGPLRLKGVARGQWRELTAAEVRSLRKAAAAGARESGREGEEPSAKDAPQKKARARTSGRTRAGGRS